MRIGVILNYFDYFLNFPHYDKENTYIFISANKRFKIKLGNALNLFSINKYLSKNFQDSSINFENYFAFGLKSQLIKYPINPAKLARIYEIYFEELFNRIKIDMLLTGGVTGFERCALKIAKNFGIKTIVVWEGQFRPKTISYDCEGMNAESSIFHLEWKRIIGYELTEGSLNLYNKYLTLLKNHNKTIIKRIGNNLYDKSFLDRFVRHWVERNYFERTSLPYSKLFFRKIDYILRRKKYVFFITEDKPFFYFPLQVHTDSNYLINSNFSSISKSIEIIKQAFLNSNISKEYYLCIKEHPLDVLRAKYSFGSEKGVIWLNPFLSSNEILNHPLCKGTITINSTTGLESLMLGKPVLALGKAIYTKKELCNFNYSCSVEVITNSIDHLLESKVQNENVDNFCRYLIDNHQLEGNLSVIPEKKEIEKIVKKIF